MTASSRLPLAHSLALLGPSALLGGALAFQHLGGLAPCEMCFWQRWPHLAAIVLGLLALVLRGQRRPLVILAGIAILVAAALGLFHAGVEQDWWEGPSACTAALAAGSDMLTNVLAAPVVRCDAVAWQMWGLSLAAWNAILSTIIGGTLLWLTIRK